MVMHYIVIAVFVSVSPNIQETHVNVQPYKPIALVRILKCQMTPTKYVLDMERANAIIVIVTMATVGHFVRAQSAMKHTIHCVCSMSRVHSVLSTVGSVMNVWIMMRNAHEMECYINQNFMMISQVSRCTLYLMKIPSHDVCLHVEYTLNMREI